MLETAVPATQLPIQFAAANALCGSAGVALCAWGLTTLLEDPVRILGSWLQHGAD